ncbi:MAG: GPW/gp25 family protein [Clostridiales Family XIII bacterium]|nr:GPW/gp25 family protein [Clostridiales Family XIII bacterium]
MKFPVQANKATGRFAVSTGAQNVKESIFLILMTQAGERWLEPLFGASLQGYAFMDVNLTNLTLLRGELARAIRAQEPRIDSVDIRFDDAAREDCLLVNVSYRIAASNTPDNLVFPFYLKQEAPDADTLE